MLSHCFQPALFSSVFLTNYDYVVASFICRYQDVFVVEIPESCPTPCVFQNLSFLVLYMPRDLSRLNVVFIKKVYHAHPLNECAQVSSFPVIVNSLYAQFQTKVPVDIILLSKMRAFSNERSKFPIGMVLKSPVTTWPKDW